MKVNYKCTITRINETIDYAKENDLEIESIELVPAEWYRFIRKSGAYGTAIFESRVMYRDVDIIRNPA